MKKTLTTETELRELYGFPSGRAAQKVLSELEKHSINFIEHSPFLVLSTTNNQGKMDASPRGGEPGFVKIISKNQIIIPDFKGNNRIDSLVNIVETKIAGLLFVIPGIDETLRINGTAMISTDPELLKLIDTEFKAPISCIVITAQEIFLHCAKAFMRSDLWGESNKISQDEFPSMGIMIKEQINSDVPAEPRSEMKIRYQKDL